MQSVGGECVFTSEWDQDAKATYEANYGEVPYGDIRAINKKEIPDHDILCGGFPCQAFSIAGRQEGFDDVRGTLFFDIAQIISEKRPKAIFLENVKNLQAHDGGRTFKVMLDVLGKQLDYSVSFRVLNSMTHANVPQNRERIFIVAFDRKRYGSLPSFTFPDAVPLTATIHDVLDHNEQDDFFYFHPTHPYFAELDRSIISGDTLYQWRRIYVRENKSNVCPTLTANMGTGGHNVPIIRDDWGIRKLTPRECFRFQGYPEEFVFPKIARTKLYMQAGNSVTMPLLKRIAEQIAKVL
jgi:DNA (cytosine-5)-methyltransferase 1